ncbi:YIP1 family protein [Cohnella yongneupensis]|uniref:YIP1 family protein n=1 Tax=Cohnella yongneupensis TaxID=425006 RepID=A0ABW0QUV4_9BACL
MHNSIKFPLRLITRPFDGFWDMKHEGKGRLSVAFSIVFLLVIVMILQKQYAGFLVNMNDPRYINGIDELKFIVIPFFLWCVSNWSVTTLMEGEGKFKDIVMVLAYSLVPIILIYLPMTIISNFMAQEETSFYYLFNSFALLWFVFLLFVGTMTVHQYTATKSLVTMLLTLLVMAIIVFLAMLMFSMIQQIVDFIRNLYTELVFRV